MKKLSITLFLLLTTFVVFSQDGSRLKNYVGTYEIAEGPIQVVKVGIKDGKLFGSSDQGDAPLASTVNADEFEIEGYGGSVVFVRKKGVVVSMTMKVQGQEMQGERRMPAVIDYTGNYIFEGAPFASMLVSTNENEVYGEVQGMGKGMFDKTSNLDEFTEATYNSTITFKRDEKGVVTGVVILAQGSEMVGIKEMSATKN